MKFSITVTDLTREEAVAFITGVNSSALTAGMIITTMPASGHVNPLGSPPAADHNNNDDDNGAANANAPAADGAGIPWDERIHSGNKALNTDGTWRKRRGVTTDTVTNVENELKARTVHSAGMYMQPAQPMMQPPMSGPVSMPGYPPMSLPDLPPQLDRNNPANYTQQPAPSQHIPQMQQIPSIQSAPQMQQQQPQPMDFNSFMAHLSNQMQKRDGSGQPLINVDYLTSVTARLSQIMNKPFNSITDIEKDINAIYYAVQIISSDNRWN